MKQGDPAPETRQRIYESARQALQRMIDGNAQLDAASADAQRSRLEDAISEIEASYAPSDQALARASQAQSQVDEPKVGSATPPPFRPEPEPAADPTIAPTATPRIDPGARLGPAAASTRPDGRREPGFGDAETPASAVPPVTRRPTTPASGPAPISVPGGANVPPFAASGRRAHRLEPGFDEAASARDASPELSTQDDFASSPEGRRVLGRERRPYAKMLIWTIVLVAIGVALWWSYTFLSALLMSQVDGSVPNPRPTIESGPFVPEGESADGWITVFAPETNAQDVVTGGNGAAELVREDAQSIMRMASPDGNARNNLLVKVPQGLIESLRGDAATFEVTVRTVASDAQEFTIMCEFGRMGSCGRKRFTAAESPEPFLFDVLINDTTLANGEEAFLSFNTDLAGEGRALDLFSVRVRTER